MSRLHVGVSGTSTDVGNMRLAREGVASCAFLADALRVVCTRLFFGCAVAVPMKHRDMRMNSICFMFMCL